MPPEPEGALAAAEALPVRPPDRVGVATSGGPDSLAALVLVARVCVARGVAVFALHVDHGLRGEASAGERALVARAAAAAGAGFAARAVDVGRARSAGGGSIEFVARTLRHEALDRMAVDLALSHVVLAHHEDDQIETVILSILRGAWPAALAGMPAQRRMPGGALLVRPFLSVPRDALRAHSAALGPAADPMNLDRAYRRVAVRERLLPALLNAGPGAGGILLGIAGRARALEQAAAALGARLMSEPGAHAEPGAVVSAAAPLREAGRFGRAAFLRRACETDAAFGHATWPLCRAFERAVFSEEAFAEEVRRGVLLTARAGVIALFADAPGPRAGASAVFTGEAVRLRADAVREVLVEPLAPGAAPSPGVAAFAVPPGARLEVRPRRAKDRFRLGPQGTKLVADEFSDRKIQPVWRSRIPLLFVDGELRWIAGVRAAGGGGSAAPNVTVKLAGPMPWV